MRLQLWDEEGGLAVRPDHEEREAFQGDGPVPAEVRHVGAQGEGEGVHLALGEELPAAADAPGVLVKADHGRPPSETAAAPSRAW